MHVPMSVVWVVPVAELHAEADGIAAQSVAGSPAEAQQLAAFVQAEQSAGTAPAPPAPVDPAAPLAPAAPLPAAPLVPAAPLIPPVPPIWQAGSLAMHVLNAVQSLIEKQLLRAESIALWLVHCAP